MNLQKIALGTLLLTLLAACGGGGGSEETIAEDGRKVPASALTSATAYSQWAGSLMNSETGEPVSVEDGMMAPKSEIDTPIEVR